MLGIFRGYGFKKLNWTWEGQPFVSCFVEAMEHIVIYTLIFEM